MNQVKSTEVVDYAKIGAPIEHEVAAKMVKDHVDAHSEETYMSYIIGNDILSQIMAQPGCEAVRFYPAQNADGSSTLVYVGVDRYGKIITEYTYIGENGKLVKVEALIGDFTRGLPSDTGSGKTSWV